MKKVNLHENQPTSWFGFCFFKKTNLDLSLFLDHVLINTLSINRHQKKLHNTEFCYHFIDFIPYLTNGFSHYIVLYNIYYYHLVESTFILRDIRGDFEFLFHFSMEFL